MTYTPTLTAPPRTRIDRVTFSYQDERNAARTVRGIGFRAYCGCGDASGRVASYLMARGWLREHARTHKMTD